MSLPLFVLVLSAGVLHAVWNFSARRISGNLAVFWWSMWVGSLAMVPVIAGVAVAQGQEGFVRMLRDGYPYILATGTIHTVYFFMLARAYEHGEISVVYPVARGSGIGITAFLGWLLLDEPVTRVGVAGIGLICGGILSMGLGVVRRNPHALHGFKSALGVGLTIVGYSVVDKFGVAVVHPTVYITGMFGLTALFLWPTVARRFEGRLWETMRTFWPSILLIGLGSVVTYLMILFALTMGPVSYIVALREFAVVVGACLGVVLLKEPLTPGKIGAILAITAGLVCIKMG
jgi:drug/metabolite transporter (DMT)-like permease